MLNDKDIDRVAARCIAALQADKFNTLTKETADKVAARMAKRTTEYDHLRIKDAIVQILRREPLTLRGICQALAWPEVNGALNAIRDKLGDLRREGRIKESVNDQDVVVYSAGSPVRLDPTPTIDDVRRAVIDACEFATTTGRRVTDVVNELEKATGARKATKVATWDYRKAIDAMSDFINNGKKADAAAKELLSTDEDGINEDRQALGNGKISDFLNDPNALFAAPVPEHRNLPPLGKDDFDFACCRAIWSPSHRYPGRGVYKIVHRPDNLRLGFMTKELARKMQRAFANIEEQALRFKRTAIRNRTNAADYAELERIAENRAKHLAAAEDAIRAATAELTASKAAMKQLSERLDAYEDDSLADSNKRLQREVTRAEREVKESDERERNLALVLGRRTQEVSEANAALTEARAIIARFEKTLSEGYGVSANRIRDIGQGN